MRLSPARRPAGCFFHLPSRFYRTGWAAAAARDGNPQFLSPYEESIATAKERGCDSIFMASHGRRGLTGVLLGSETHKVLTHSTIPVMVFR